MQYIDSIGKKTDKAPKTGKIDKNWFQQRNHITGYRVGNGYTKK